MVRREASCDDAVSAIDVTPLVDVVLGLLAATVVASATSTASIAADLPHSCSPPHLAMLTVSVDEDETLYLDGDRTAWAELESRARAFTATHDAHRAVLAIAPRARHDVFVRALDDLRRGGFESYAILVDAR